MVIEGGSFAGLACARSLAKRRDVRITLIDKRSRHQFRPLLYQLATGEIGAGDLTASLRQSLRGHPDVDAKMTEVIAADLTTPMTTREAAEPRRAITTTCSSPMFSPRARRWLRQDDRAG